MTSLTLLPAETFKESARSLESSDLRSSIIVAKEIITNKNYNSLCQLMWKGYEGCLLLYAHTFLTELKKRNEETGILEASLPAASSINLDKLPPWFFDIAYENEKKKLIESHRDFLTNRNPVRLYYPKKINARLDPVFQRQPSMELI